ncbi:hypothetical protein [Legionella brunensis]|uniref:Uncharacterized protein n=1 Tax=Legionella brunensis TaxID=29422 RepID=A0A0W0SNL6_9GAMM|nr:hypothetical protein [Legionella brunensis]KTC84960.1 hypothetical protein Lbru_1175 [Legionella brunensis]
MTQKASWYNWLTQMFKEFMVETTNKSLYEVVNIYECKKTGFTKAVIKLSERHAIEKNISDIIVDNEFIEGLDKKTIRTLTYIATVERLKPDYSIVVQQMTSEVDEYILEIKSKNGCTTIKKSPSEISKDAALISRLNPVEANRIGYMAGVRETVKEYQIIYNKN